MKGPLNKLGDLEDSQMEAALLHSCLALPKVAHLLRTCPPDVNQGALEKFDELMREAVSDLAGCSLSNWAWLKSSLPSSLGGLNIRHATLHAPAAFIGSFQQSESVISDILGHPAKAPQHLSNTISALARLPQNGSPLKVLTFHCATPSPAQSMRPASPSFWRGPPMSGPKLWPYRLRFLMPVTG